MRPRIGISTSTLERGPEGPIRTSAATHLTYAECVYQAGGLPLLLPNLPDITDADEVLAHLDGVLLSGGGDIDPSYWGEAPHPALGTVDPVRDRFEIALAQAALRRDLPLLAICRGVQVLTIATGGDLWQDIPSQRPDSLPHKQHIARHLPSHDVRVAPDSLLARVLWPDGTDDVLLPVNSMHHQAPRACGTRLTPVAWCTDDIVEALTATDAFFILGVQWHPEEMAATDPRQARLFSALIHACAGRIHERQ